MSIYRQYKNSYLSINRYSLFPNTHISTFVCVRTQLKNLLSTFDEVQISRLDFLSGGRSIRFIDKTASQFVRFSKSNAFHLGKGKLST